MYRDSLNIFIARGRCIGTVGSPIVPGPKPFDRFSENKYYKRSLERCSEIPIFMHTESY